ncbi:MAG: hypothetical protein ABI779_20345 [Acidobacteriota bacterium]
MRNDRNEHDLIEELERMDRFFDGTEEGDVPLEVLRARSIEMPEESSLDDAALHGLLWKVIHGMAEIGMFLECTDHLSDRELYRYLAEALMEETMLGAGMEQLSPIGGCSEEDNAVYLRYYADEEDRKNWDVDGMVIPPHEPLPYDRDRLLPGHALGDDGQPS